MKKCLNINNQKIESGLIDTQDLSTLFSLSKEMENVFEKSQTYRTRTEMEVSVLNELNFPTPASKYWQSMREQHGMFEGVISLSFKYKKENIKIKMLKREMLNEADKLKIELLEVEIDEKIYQLSNIKRAASSKIKELKDWSEIKSRESKLMSKSELNNVDNHQLISYTIRWIRQTIQMGNGGSPAERHNLIGQLNSGIKACKEKGLWADVLYGFDLQTQKFIEQQLGDN